jgi:hypothetical protein
MMYSDWGMRDFSMKARRSKSKRPGLRVSSKGDGNNPCRTRPPLLHQEPMFSELFMAYLLTRNSWIEEDLIDQLFNSSEKRLARLLLLLAHFGKKAAHQSTHRSAQRSGHLYFAKASLPWPARRLLAAMILARACLCSPWRSRAQGRTNYSLAFNGRSKPHNPVRGALNR